MDGTQLEAASLKSFRCRDAAPSARPDDPGNPTVDFHGERRRNDTHQSTTDPEAMLLRDLAIIIGLAIPIVALAHRVRVPKTRGTLVGFLLVAEVDEERLQARQMVSHRWAQGRMRKV